MIFHGAEYYSAFLQCLAEANQRFGPEIVAYCLITITYWSERRGVT